MCGGFPHIPFGVGFGRSGPSQTCPRTRWLCHPQPLPVVFCTIHARKDQPQTISSAFLDSGMFGSPQYGSLANVLLAWFESESQLRTPGSWGGMSEAVRSRQSSIAMPLGTPVRWVLALPSIRSLRQPSAFGPHQPPFGNHPYVTPIVDPQALGHEEESKTPPGVAG